MTSLVEGEGANRSTPRVPPRTAQKTPASALVEVVKILALDAARQVETVEDLGGTHALATDAKRSAQKNLGPHLQRRGRTMWLILRSPIF